MCCFLDFPSIVAIVNSLNAYLNDPWLEGSCPSYSVSVLSILMNHYARFGPSLNHHRVMVIWVGTPWHAPP